MTYNTEQTVLLEFFKTENLVGVNPAAGGSTKGGGSASKYKVHDDALSQAETGDGGAHLGWIMFMRIRVRH